MVNSATRPDHVWTTSPREVELRYDTGPLQPFSDHWPLIITTTVVTIDPLAKRFSRIKLENTRKYDYCLKYAKALNNSATTVNEVLSIALELPVDELTKLTLEDRRECVTIACEVVNEWLRTNARAVFGLFNADSKRSIRYWNGDKNALHLQIHELERIPRKNDETIGRIRHLKEKLADTDKRLRQKLHTKFNESLDKRCVMFQKYVSCMKKRENRTGCRLDPEKMPEYLQHFGSTFQVI